MSESGLPANVGSNEGLGIARGAHRFMAVACKPHAQIAGDMAEEIKAVIYKHAGAIPLALAIGVLRIVERELLEDA